MVLMVELSALVVAAAPERSQGVERGLAVQSKLIVELAQILEARFIYDLRANDLRIANLYGVLGRVGVIALRSQVELTDAFVILDISVELIAEGEGVVFAECVVETRGDIGSRPGKRYPLDDGCLGESGGI